jgi:hypothetical protein
LASGVQGQLAMIGSAPIAKLPCQSSIELDLSFDPQPDRRRALRSMLRQNSRLH